MDFEPPQSSLPGSPEEDPMNPDFTMEGTEPAWERKEEIGFFPAYMETIQQVLLRPGETFDRLFVGGGFVKPLIFAIIGGTAVAVVNAIIGMFFQGAMAGILASAGTASSGGIDPTMQAILNAASGWLGALFAPVVVSIYCFILAGAYHVSLMMLGDMKGDFETTFRVVTYSYGASVVIGLVPICGPFVGIVWGVVCTIIGLSRAHQVETWKGVVAWLITCVICCTLVGVLYGLLFAVAIAFGAAIGGAAGSMP